MEQNTQPQPVPSVSLGRGVFLIFIFFILVYFFYIFIYFFVILNIKVSKIDNNTWNIALKSVNYQAILADPQYVYPYYSKYVSAKISLVRNDIPKSMQAFLMVRGTYQLYFYSQGINNNFVGEILSDIPGLIRHPFGFGELLMAKYSHNQYGYPGNK